jgi:SAM-dependent methyltransferase
MIPSLQGSRLNLLDQPGEAWQPPAFHRAISWSSRILAACRRFPDLQASSIWSDLIGLLSHCRGTVLDVGCGAQPYRSLFPRDVQYSGIDTVNAAEHFGYSVPDTTYFSGTVWPVASGTVDTVIATETLEHVEDPRQFLSEARRVLKNDGWILLTVPFSARWHYIPQDYWRFTPSGLRILLESSGFETPVVYGRGNEMTVACYKVMTLLFMLLMGTFEHSLLKAAARLTGLLLTPVLFGLAIIGQLTLRMRSGNDCLGYTVIAAVQTASGVTDEKNRSESENQA